MLISHKIVFSALSEGVLRTNFFSMKKHFFISCFSFLNLLSFAQYPSQNITLLSHWDTTKTIAEPIYDIRYSSVWGWADTVKHREYAIIGSTDGTYFIDVTNPAQPVKRGYVPGPRDSCIWREFKTYKNYLYMSSDDATSAWNKNNLQIIDMSYLPDSVHLVYNTDTLIVRSHTIFIDGDKLYGGYVHYNQSQYYAMAIYSLANPIAPTYIRSLDSDYVLSGGNIVHDMYVRNDTVYASCSYDGLHIYEFNPSSPKFTELGSLTGYEPGGAYNHSSALTADGKTLIFADEEPANLKVKSVDVTNFSNLTILDKFSSTPTTTATPHNPFIRKGKNDRCVISYYADGVQIFDITNPSIVTRTGYFISSPGGCSACPNQNYFSCWGVYIDLPSGIILASDMQHGLFVLDASAAMNGVNEIANEISADVYPNPFTNNFQINFSLPSAEKFSYELSDLNGKIILKKEISLPSGKNSVSIDGKNLSEGEYMLTIKGEKSSLTKKLIKTNK